MREALRGDTCTFSLGTLLQAAESEGITGVIRFAPEVEVGLHAGAPVRARHHGLAGVEALLEMFLRPLPPFVVHVGAEPAAPPLGVTVGLVLDACRLQDDWARVAPLVLAARDATSLPAEVRALPLDGRQPVWAAVDAAGTSRARVIDPLLGGLEAGHLVEAAPPVAAPPETATAPVQQPVTSHPSGPTPAHAGDYDLALGLGRRLVREGRFGEARAAFEHALAVRPEDGVARQNLRRLAALSERA